MKYTTDISLDSFDAWSGGAKWLEELSKHDEAYEAVADYLEDATACGDWSRTDVNDFLWFDMPDMLEEWGYYDGETDTWSDEDK